MRNQWSQDIASTDPEKVDEENQHSYEGWLGECWFGDGTTTSMMTMTSSEHDRQLRAELAAELGWYPAELDAESVAGQRRLAASPDRAPSLEQISCKYAHLGEEKRQRDIEAAGRAAFADLWEEQ
jgi:hypothetical protein